MTIRNIGTFVRRNFAQHIKFATSSSVATAVDYGLYLLLVGRVFTPVTANLISASSGFLVNFFLQKKYIFLLQRKTHHALFISAGFSVIGIGISTALIWLLNHMVFFQTHQYITKLVVIGLVFFYNFYTKRFAFERSARAPTE